MLVLSGRDSKIPFSRDGFALFQTYRQRPGQAHASGRRDFAEKKETVQKFREQFSD